MAKPRSRIRNMPKKKSTLNLVVTDQEPVPIHGVLVGKLVGFQDNMPLVSYPSCLVDKPVLSKSTCTLSEKDIGREVALMFESGDAAKPIIMGLMETQPKEMLQAESADQKPLDVHLDGERLEFTANKEIVLKCGKAMITLTRAGKIILRGAYLLSRSSGVNRIKGGSIHLN